MFGRPSSGVHKTVVAASDTDHTTWEASFPDSMICTRGYSMWKASFPDSMICTRGFSMWEASFPDSNAILTS